MTATYQIIQPDANATTYNISDGTYCQVISVDGIGISTVERITDGYPTFDGHRDFGAILHPRKMTLNLFFSAASDALADARRDVLYKIFRPFEQPILLKITRDNGSIRQIDCHVTDTNDMPFTGRVGSSQNFSINLLAPDPIFYDPTLVTKTITPSASPWNDTIVYSGNRAYSPIIKVYGQVSNFTMSLTNSFYSSVITIPEAVAGDVWTFDCRPGYRTIKNSAGAGKFNTVDSNTLNALYGLRLAPTNFVSGGSNSFDGTYTSKDANHKIEILYYNRYWGA